MRISRRSRSSYGRARRSRSRSRGRSAPRYSFAPFLAHCRVGDGRGRSSSGMAPWRGRRRLTEPRSPKTIRTGQRGRGWSIRPASRPCTSRRSRKSRAAPAPSSCGCGLLPPHPTRGSRHAARTRPAGVRQCRPCRASRRSHRAPGRTPEQAIGPPSRHQLRSGGPRAPNGRPACS